MSFHFAQIAQEASADRVITSEEILQLRKAGWADGKMDRQEAEALFTAQHAVETPSEEWSDFFVQAVMNYVLDGSEPKGYASQAEGDWLIGQVMQDGQICSMAELEVLVAIIERGKNVPASLKQFVLEALEREVLTGTGPTRCGGELSDTHVSAAECAIIRRVIFGAAGDRPAGVSKSEAEMLYRLKNASELHANAPEFKKLFAQGVGNFLQGLASQNGQIDRTRALELEAFIADNSSSVGGFLGKMAGSIPEAFDIVFGEKKDTAPSREECANADHKVTSQEQQWLDQMVASNGHVDQYDEALLRFIAKD